MAACHLKIFQLEFIKSEIIYKRDLETKIRHYRYKTKAIEVIIRNGKGGGTDGDNFK